MSIVRPTAAMMPTSSSVAGPVNLGVSLEWEVFPGLDRLLELLAGVLSDVGVPLIIVCGVSVSVWAVMRRSVSWWLRHMVTVTLIVALAVTALGWW